MIKHTPGPWTFRESPLGREFDDWPVFWIDAPDGDGASSIAEVRYGCEEAADAGDCEANARLMAAAPDLLECLRNIIADYETGWADMSISLRDDVLDAIAKASP